jgi:hypothetical protein
VLVIPNKEATKLTAEILSAKRNLDSASAVVFHCEDESLHDGDTSVRADGAEPRLDSFAATPSFVPLAPELLAFVADDVFGRLFHPANGTSEERSNGGRLRYLRKNGEAHETSRIVVDGHRDPPAERPLLRTRERNP